MPAAVRALRAVDASAAGRVAEPRFREPVLSDLAAETEAYLRDLSDKQLVCLAYGHPWPRLDPRRGLPRGFSAVPDRRRAGCFQVTERCPNCGNRRVSVTLPMGIFDTDVHRGYDYPDDWQRRPPGSRLTRRDFTAEIYRRMSPVLFTEHGGQP